MIVAEGTFLGVENKILRTLQWGRNLIVAEGSAIWSDKKERDCFNGAAT